MAAQRRRVTRRLVLQVLGGGAALAVAGPLAGCGGGPGSITVGDLTFDSGDLVAIGTAFPGETPAQLFARVTEGLEDEAKLRGFVTWREIQGDLAHLTTPDRDDAALSAEEFRFAGGEDIGFFVAEFEAIMDPEAGTEFAAVEDQGPSGTQMVAIRDHAHYQPAPIGDTVRSDDVVLYVRPEAANSGPVPAGAVA